MFLFLKQSLAVWLIRKIQRYGPKRVRVMGKSFEISENVFNPKFYYTSEFMARHVNVRPEDAVLDMGTGSGIQAVIAGQTAQKVVAVDINPEAVKFAKNNIKANGLENRVLVVEGDLFSAVDCRQKFSVILFTPPYMEGKPETFLEHALYDSDKELINRFFRDAREHIEPGGYVQMLYSSIAAPYHALEISASYGWNNSLLAQEKTFMETFMIYRLSLNKNKETQSLSKN